MEVDAITELMHSRKERVVEPSVVDLFLDEFSDSWNLANVELGQDDGGRTLDVYVEEPAGDSLRRNCPSRYMGVRTVVLEVPADEEEVDVQVDLP